MSAHRPPESTPGAMIKTPNARCTSLQQRVDGLLQDAAKSRADLSVAIPHEESSNLKSRCLPTPFLSRAGIDFAVPQPVASVLSNVGAKLGIVTSATLQETDAQAENKMLPLWSDIPIDTESLANATIVELQLRSDAPATATARGRRSYWASRLPVDLWSASQLTKRIDLIRQLSNHTDVIVGAALAPGNVYEDVRLLIDSDVDYVSLLCDVMHTYATNSSIRLMNPELAVSEAVRARSDSKRDAFRIFLTSSATTMDQVIQWLTSGVSAVSIDTYWTSQKPPTPTVSSSDGFSSFLSGYSAPTQMDLSWLQRSLHEIVDQLRDSIEYAGFSNLADLIQGE